MRKLVLLGSAIMLTLLLGCASTKMVRTEEQPIPPATGAGALDIVLTPLKDMEKEKISFLKAKLTEKFEQAGFTRVAVVQTRGNAPQEINIKLTNYEFTQTKESEQVAGSAAAASVCICLAPVLGAPRYFDDQYEITADVTAYRNGRVLFKETVTEKAHSTANVMEAGSANFKAELEELTLHNLVATVVNRWNKR
ncbi:MAG TPA: hypothetical protein VMU60_02215 [Syntrophobacteria bacterium]|nr:hypothetical protein [Syntrophobacteria bacterium]